MRWPGLAPQLVPFAEEAMRRAQRANIRPRVTSVRRNWGEQEELYANYQRGLSPFPANPPGESPHQYGVAWDSVVPAHDQPVWDQIRASVGWKLYPHDPVHAELPNWRTVKHYLRLT
jgi:hypothetical protein